MHDHSGSERIRVALQARRQAGQIALIPYVTIGYPTGDATPEIVAALAGAGADAVELGIPFSDPLADGPTIQAASTLSLAQGTTVAACLRTAEAISARTPGLPLLFMGYYNPILQFGPARFAEAACRAGVSGVIVPDLPLEEAEEFDAPCRAQGLGIVPMVAPTTGAARIRRLAERGPAFVYVTTRLGVTGARGVLPEDVPDLLARVRRETDAPVGVGFGISRAEHVRALRPYADAAIVGSALLDAIGTGSDPAAAAAAFLAPLAAAAAGPA